MAISTYYVGQIPAKPIAIDVKDSNGLALSLAGYTDFKVRLIGSDNEEIDLTGSMLSTGANNNGRFVFRFPTDRSVFTQPGEYLMQLELIGPGARDFTTEHYIRVKKSGGVN